MGPAWTRWLAVDEWLLDFIPYVCPSSQGGRDHPEQTTHPIRIVTTKRIIINYVTLSSSNLIPKSYLITLRPHSDYYKTKNNK